MGRQGGPNFIARTRFCKKCVTVLLVLLGIWSAEHRGHPHARFPCRNKQRCLFLRSFLCCRIWPRQFVLFLRASPRKVHDFFQSREIDPLKQPLRGDQKQCKKIRFTARALVLCISSRLASTNSHTRVLRPATLAQIFVIFM